MYIVIKSWYPTHLIPKVNEKYLEAVQKFPVDDALGETLGPVASKATKKGIKTLSIFDVKEGKFEEAIARLVEFMSMFNDIEGYEWTIENWKKAPEA